MQAGVEGEPGARSESLTPFRAAPAAVEQARCSAVAVVSGDGLREMFHELGIHTSTAARP